MIKTTDGRTEVDTALRDLERQRRASSAGGAPNKPRSSCRSVFERFYILYNILFSRPRSWVRPLVNYNFDVGSGKYISKEAAMHPPTVANEIRGPSSTQTSSQPPTPLSPI